MLSNFKLRNLMFTGCMFLIAACTQQTDSDLESALKYASKNRIELEKVLKKYSSSPKDSMKLKSAIFLIKNMPGHYNFSGTEVSNYSKYFKALNSSSTKEPKEILDSLSEILSEFSLNTTQKRYDIETIDSAYLCENIELAFDAWQKYPWSKGYDFKVFSEYILPYRIGNEKLTRWRQFFLKRYSYIVDDVNLIDPIQVASVIRDSIISRNGTPRFTMVRPLNYPTLDAISSIYTSGNCSDLTQFVISLFRTFGIAVSEDFMPLRGDANVGHSWAAIFGRNNELYNSDFLGKIEYVSETMINRLSSKAKVYRHKYSFNKAKELQKYKGQIPDEFYNMLNRSEDVTKWYSNNLIDLQFSKAKLYANNTNAKIVYLCAPSWLEWSPIAWCKYNNGDIKFKDINGGGNILRIASIDKNGIKFLSPPFLIERQNRSITFLPDAKQADMEDATFFSKFTINREKSFRNRMINGVFECANNKDFKNSDTLFIIQNAPSRLFTEINLTNQKKYRFFRYKGADSSYCNVAEIEVYSGNEKLTGNVIGKAGAQKNDHKHEYTAAFDGLTETSFDHSTPSEGWVGLSFEQARDITRIRYTPRNYDNYVKPGDIYELFVSQKDRWVSFGRKVAMSDSLSYDKIPKGAFEVA